MEKIVKVDVQFVRDLFTDISDNKLNEQYGVDRRTIKNLRVQYCTRANQKRTTNAQPMHNVVNISEVKKHA
ncbi:MAG: hypothetical protein IPL26_12895 [Leptospiraceae bacterium]|nr:hypothetical protein [Leptospiraceae bacterium]